MPKKMTPEEMLAKINDRVDQEEAADEAEQVAATGGAGSGGGDDGNGDLTDTDGSYGDFVRQCFEADELGDSILYNDLHRGKYICNEISEDWMKYVGPHWAIDYLRSSSKASIEEVVKLYLEHVLGPVVDELDQLDDDKKDRRKTLINKKKLIKSRITKLRQDYGKNSLLRSCTCNTDPLTINYHQFDQNTDLFPCANGVYDLWIDKFYEGGDPEHYITVECPTAYDTTKKADCPLFKKYLLEILGDDKELYRYVLRLLGYAMCGRQEEHIFIVLHGPHGRNGKGTLINVLSKVVGPLVSKINTELLMEQRYGRSTNSPSPEIMDMKGKRLIWADETRKGGSFAHDQVKVFSGGNPLKGRGLNDKHMTEFMPTHLLFLLCNDLPKAPPDDEAFWARIRVITFPNSYREICTEPYHKPIDKKLEKKLVAEAPGILQLLFDGFADWRENGMQTPDKVLVDSAKYRESVDDLQEWLDENCAIDKDDHSTDNRSNSTMLYSNYFDWSQRTNPADRPLDKKEFSNQLQAKGFKKIKSGKTYYQYIRLVIKP